MRPTDAELLSIPQQQTTRPTVKAVTVFLSSAKKVGREFFDAARDMGAAIAKENWTLVYGGNYIGCMAALADGARSMGGHVVGITPRLFVDENVADTLCDELIITDHMRDRKHQLERRGDAFVALPGGLGTFEELFEIIVGRQLGFHAKPIVLVNLNDYYTPLLQMLDRGVEEHFVRAEARKIIDVSTSVSETIDILKRH